MIGVRTFKSVRARLLAMMVFVIIPIFILGLILASTTYRSVIKGVEEAQIQTASNFAVRARVWYRGSLRTLIATALSIQAVDHTAQQCGEMARNVLDGMGGFQALHFRLASGMQCHAASSPDISGEALTALADSQKNRPAMAPWVGSNLADSYYGTAKIGARIYLLIHARKDDQAGRRWEATLLAHAFLLDQTFDLGSASDNSIIALMSREHGVIAARGAAEADRTWLPQDEKIQPTVSRWEAYAHGGGRYAYTSQLVAEPDLYVLSRFANETSQAAWLQFMVLFLTPLLTLIVLFVTYMRVIQTNIVQWIAGIEKAARIRQADPSATVVAPVDPRMPEDIRSVAEAFNNMVDEASRRETVLTQALDTNKFLMRELHHRVKNSLQVIQSYLALSRRQKSGVNSAHLAETEAKVQVLSTAYRLALSESGMLPVPIKPFAEEVLGNLRASMRKRNQWVGATVETDASLVVDRIIPLGLALVEAATAALQAENATFITIELKRSDRVPGKDHGEAQGHTDRETDVYLSVKTNGQVTAGVPSPRIMAGLAAQLGAATASVTKDGEIINWHFTA